MATNNSGKLKEFKAILSDYELIGQRQAGVDIEVPETGSTFEENAMQKAKAIMKLTGNAAIADDSGLCVDAMGGEPGIFSARYAGENATNEERINKLLKRLKTESDRSAKFVSAIAYAAPDGTEFTVTGECKGEILNEPEGEGGFGYDPIFYSYELKKSFGIAEENEKNAVSHRAAALKKFRTKLAEIV